ncbi:MFS transporter [Crenobacter cavernae]|uniref:MFS transporter n=2 Tax=Crenobacter cavernae TaxID=2290923 RepID=A0A345Y9P8_9NEIS|nr:MFS transporter [Crenobacter cavernae]
MVMDKRIYLLAFVNFSMGLVEMFPAGILSRIAEELSVSVSVAGQMLGLFSLTFAIAAPVLQVLTARFERRRVLMITLAVFAAGTLWGVFAPTFAEQMAARVVQAAAGGLMCSTAFALAAQIADPAFRGRAIALAAMGISSSIVLGVPLGILVAEQIGWRAMYVLTVVFAALAFVGVWRWLPKVQGSGAVPLSQQLRTLRSAKLLSAHTVTFLLMWGHFAMYAFLAPFMEQVVGLDSRWMSVVYLAFGAAGMTGGFLGGYSSDRWGGVRSVTGAGCALALALALLPFAAASLWLVLPVVMLWGMSAWGSTPSVQHYITSTSPETAGIQLGLNLAALNFGISMGAAVGGLTLEFVSIRYNPWVGALAVIFGVLVARYSARLPYRRLAVA